MWFQGGLVTSPLLIQDRLLLMFDVYMAAVAAIGSS